MIDSSSMRTGLVVSDLHLFSPRSEGGRLFIDEVETRLAERKFEALVLNGDTFDFRWSRFPSEAAAIDAAIRWLEGLIRRQPGLDVHYLLGNHDCLAIFRSELEDLARGARHLHCHEYRLRLGRNLFLHGDCANRPMNHRALEKFRTSWSHDRQRGALASAIYEATDTLGLSRRFHGLYFPERNTVRRIAYHLDRVEPGWPDEIRHCYFGHTHRPFRDRRWRGIRFSNTGSGIRGMGFQPLSFRWNSSDAHRRITR